MPSDKRNRSENALTRKPDWQSALHHFLFAHANLSFRYGEHDCCLFVADAVLAITGTDIAASFRGRYHSRREALAIAKDYSGKASFRALIEKALAEQGLAEIPVRGAQRGDIVLVKRPREHSLGIISLSGREILAPSCKFSLRIPLSLAVRAWRV